MSETIIIKARLTLSDHMPYFKAADDEREWIDNVIFKENLILHSNEIGDEIGTVEILELLVNGDEK